MTAASHDALDGFLSDRARALTPSAIREIGKRAGAPGMISFAGGMPSPDTFPVDALRSACDTVLSKLGRAALQYAPTDGFAPLRAWIADRLTHGDARIAPEQVQITSGSQQGIAILGNVLINAGDAVAVETPTYIGALQGLSLSAPYFAAVPTDQDGLVPSGLADVIAAQRAARPCRVLYTIPTFQNPTGRTLSFARREALADEAARLELVVIEDDPYGALDYAGNAHRTLQSLAPTRVAHLGSFSKVLAPGLRLGYIVAPVSLAQKCEQVKQAVDLHTSGFTQMVVYELLRDGFLDGHLPRIREQYSAQCSAMMRALDAYFPATATWTRPAGGMFTWVTLPGHLDATQLLERALEQQVAFVPGASFYAHAPQANTLRLSFATVPPDMIDLGISRIARLLQQAS